MTKIIFSVANSFIIFLWFVLSSGPIYAQEHTSGEAPQLLYSITKTLEYGIVVTDEIYVFPEKKSDTQTAVRTRTFKTETGSMMATISFTATFYYTGSYVTVVSKAVTQTDTYNGWSYSQTSFVGSGGTVTLEGKLTKLLILIEPFTMSLSCDVNGHISYS